MFRTIREDIRTVFENDPSARSSLEVVLTYAGLHAVWGYRLAHWFYLRKCFLMARIISQLSRFFTGVEIHPAAKIGRRLFIDHGMGVVIGETAEIGDDCLLYQGVTLGGTGKEKGKRHPTLGNNVLVSSGAKIIGSIKIGDNCRIGAGSVVLKDDVPPNSTVVGIPGRVVRQNGVKVGGSVSHDLDQCNLPDPEMDRINRLEQEVQELQKLVMELAMGKGEKDSCLL